MIKFIRLLSIVLLLAASGFITASGQYRFDSWTTDDGLPQNSIRGIAQTPDGYMWFTTLDGLVRFDGLKFTVFNKNNSKGLPTNRLFNLRSSQDGSLWISTEKNDLVLIADDHPVFQRGLREIIESDASLRVVAAVGDGEMALAELRRLRPQVAVLDVDMPKRDGLEVVKAIQDENLPSKVVFLTMYNEERFLNAALDAGVSGYVVKDSAIDEITKAIHAADRGENFVSPTLATLLFKRIQQKGKAEKTPLDSLTTSERRVLKLVADARTSKQIADELFISVRTVDHHRANICSKLDLEGKNALLTYALTNRDAAGSQY